MGTFREVRAVCPYFCMGKGFILDGVWYNKEKRLIKKIKGNLNAE